MKAAIKTSSSVWVSVAKIFDLIWITSARSDLERAFSFGESRHENRRHCEIGRNRYSVNRLRSNGPEHDTLERVCVLYRYFPLVCRGRHVERPRDYGRTRRRVHFALGGVSERVNRVAATRCSKKLPRAIVFPDQPRQLNADFLGCFYRRMNAIYPVVAKIAFRHQIRIRMKKNALVGFGESGIAGL